MTRPSGRLKRRKPRVASPAPARRSVAFKADPVSTRETYVRRAAEHILRHGLSAATLRPLAQAAGTSNRMLLYYFKDKDELVTAALGAIALELAASLERQAPAGQRLPMPQLLALLRRVTRTPALLPHFQVWLELVALASRKAEPFHTIAQKICDGFLNFVTARLAAKGEAERNRQAAMLMCLFDGALVMESVGRLSIVERANEELNS